MTPEERIRALAFNAVTHVLPVDRFVSLTERQAVADAVTAVVLAEADAILHDGRRFDLWTAAVPHPGRPGYVFADERRYLAAYLASEMGGPTHGPADEPADSDGDVVADIRHAREQP